MKSYRRKRDQWLTNINLHRNLNRGAIGAASFARGGVKGHIYDMTAIPITCRERNE